jgi:hypothetical protein
MTKELLNIQLLKFLVSKHKHLGFVEMRFFLTKKMSRRTQAQGKNRNEKFS